MHTASIALEPGMHIPILQHRLVVRVCVDGLWYFSLKLFLVQYEKETLRFVDDAIGQPPFLSLECRLKRSQRQTPTGAPTKSQQRQTFSHPLYSICYTTTTSAHSFLHPSLVFFNCIHPASRVRIEREQSQQSSQNEERLRQIGTRKAGVSDSHDK